MRYAHQLLQEMQANKKDGVTELTFCLLAALGDIEELRNLWEKEKPALSTKTTETLCWAIINNASQSYHPKLRAEALLASSLHNDAKNVPLIIKLIHDPHPQVQELSLHLAEHYFDEPVQQALFDLAKAGPTDIRIKAASLLTRQKALGTESLLKEMLSDELFSQTDKIRLTHNLSLLQKELDLNWLEKTVVDSQPEIRALACFAARRDPSKKALGILLPLLHDSASLEYALEVFGLWQHLIPERAQILQKSYLDALDSPSIRCASLAAWALFLSVDQKNSADWFEDMILNKPSDQAHIACSRLIKTGVRGLALAKELLLKTSDPIMQINISAYLLSHRSETTLASERLGKALKKCSSLLCDDRESFFSWITKTTVVHSPLIHRLPESYDLLIRLRLLALQCYSGEPISAAQVETMLTDRSWGVPIAAAGFLFQELAPSLEEILSPLLEEKEETLRVQAALLLAHFSQSEKAAQILWEQFQKSTKEGKEMLALGFATLSFEKTKDRLTPLLFDASPSLRTRAAGALLASLYT